MKKVAQFTILVILVVLGFLTFAMLSERSQLRQLSENARATAVAAAAYEAIAAEKQMSAQATTIAAQATASVLQTAFDEELGQLEASVFNAEATKTAAQSMQTTLELEVTTLSEENQVYEAVLNSLSQREGSPPDIQQSTLLAIEAMGLQNNPNTRSALQESLALLPHLRAEMGRLHLNATQLSFTDDGRFLISQNDSSNGANTKLWDVASNELVTTLFDTPSYKVYEWSTDGHYLAINGWPDAPYILNLTTNEKILTLPDPTFGLEAAFSPDNKFIAYSTDVKREPDNEDSHEYDYIFVVQDLLSGEEILHEIIEPARERTAASYDRIAFSSDGRYVAGADLLRMDIWDLTTRQIVTQFPLAVDWPEVVQFSPDGNYVAVAGFGGTQLYNLLEDREVPLATPLSGDVQTLRFSTDGQYLVGTRKEQWNAGEGGAWYQGQNGTQLWDTDTGQEIIRLPEMNAGASFMGGSHQLLTINEADSIQIWDVDTVSLLTHSQLNPQLTTTISSAGTTIAGVDELGRIRIWSPEPFLTAQTLFPATVTDSYRAIDNLNQLAYSPDGFTLVTTSWDGISRFWDSETGTEEVVVLKRGVVDEIAFSPDGMKVVMGGGNYPSPAPDWEPVGFTYLQGISSTQAITLTHDNHVKDVAFAPDGRTFATATNLTQLWDATTGEEIWTCSPELVPLKLLFSPDGDQVIVLTENEVIFCDAASGETVQNFSSQPDSRFWQMVLHPNGRLLAVAETDGIFVWDLESNSLVASLPAKAIDHRAKLEFSPDGRYLGSMTHWSHSVTSPNSLLTVWQSEDWQPIIENSERLLNDFAFSPDGNYLALANDHGAVWVVALADGREINRLQEHIPKVQLAFRPDGQQIAALGRWETVLLWKWNPEDWVHEACERLGESTCPP